jgi:hypothetical protein
VRVFRRSRSNRQLAEEASSDEGAEMTLEERLEKIEAMLACLVERQTVKEFYEIEEFARIVGKSCFTCRE